MNTAETKQIRSILSRLIKEKRKAKGWSQEVFAEKSGLNMRFISLLECDINQPTISSLWLIAKALEVDLSELIKEAEKELTDE